jgi:glycosyltransferase involved in cell wall biosynthesis
MRIVQTVFGVFHHFELARELHRRGHLQRIYSTWPRSRLRREGLPESLVDTFPWLQLAEHAAARLRLPRLADHAGYANALAFDRHTLRALQRLPQLPQALIAISGSSLRTGQWLQAQGGVFVCDRGSSHQRFQQDILSQEFARWGVSSSLQAHISDPRDTAREEAIYAQADAIVVPSAFAARSFLAQGVPAAKLHTIPYGAPLEGFHPAASSPSSPSVPDQNLPGSTSFDVLFVGAVGLRKGLPYLLQAFSHLNHPQKTLCIAGSITADGRELLANLSAHHLSLDGVELVGPLPRAQLAALMARSDVLVLPSMEDGFGLVLAEAMASGCIPIASNHTGAEDLYTDGVEGFVVPAGDSQAIAHRLQQLADSPDLYRRMRAAALARVQSLGGWTTYGDQWERLLTHITHLRL